MPVKGPVTRNFASKIFCGRCKRGKMCGLLWQENDVYNIYNNVYCGCWWLWVDLSLRASVSCEYLDAYA